MSAVYSFYVHKGQQAGMLVVSCLVMVLVRDGTEAAVCKRQ